MRYILLSLLAILFVDPSFSQDIFKARVTSSNYASIATLDVIAYRDSKYENSFFAGSFSENKIQFYIPDSLNCFYIRVSNLEYELYEAKICKPLDTQQEIVLQERHYELETVVIKGFEKTEVHVVGSIAEIRPGFLLSNNSALTAESVMKSIPEILVSPHGEILVRGREIDKIYLYATPNTPKTEISFTDLNAISAEQIEAIKIDYLLSEISVHLKGMKLQGIATSSRLQFHLGKKPYGSLAQNLRVNKGNTYYWIDLRAGLLSTKPSGSSKYLINLPEDETSLSNSNTKSQMQQKFFNSKLFFEHRLDSIYSGGLQLTYAIQESPNKSQMHSSIGATNTVQSLLDNQSNSYSLSPSLFLQASYANGWSLALKAGMLASLQKSDNLGIFDYYLGEQDIIGSQVLGQRIQTNAYTAVIEGVKQWNTSSLNISTKANYLDTKTDSNFYQGLIGQSPIDSVFSNQIKEYKLEMEASVQTVLWKKYQARFASNLVFYEYHFYDTDSERLVENKLVRVLPSFSISAPIKEAKYLTFYGNSYMRSPNFQNLIFRNLSGDGFSENENNHELKPFTSYQLGLSYPLLPNSIVTFYWSTTDNMNMNYPYFSDTGVFEGNRKINLSDSQSLGLSLNYSNTFWKRLYFSANANLMHNSWKNKGVHTFSSDFVNALGNANLHYTSTTNWSFHLDYTYNSKQKLSEHIELRNTALMHFNVSKKLNDSWSVSFKVNDLLNTYKLDVYAQKDVLYENKFHQDQRYLTLGVHFGLNKGFKQKQAKENLMQDLDNRIRMDE